MILNNDSNQALLARCINNQIILQQAGVKIFNNFNRGQINITCIQNFTGKKYQIIGKSSRSSFRQIQNCLVVRTNPIIHKNLKKYIFVLQLRANNQQAKQSLHLLAAIISTLLIVPCTLQQNIQYLSRSMKKINNIQASKIKNNAHVSKLTNLLCILINRQQKGQFIIDSTQKLLTKMQQAQILNQIITTYPVIKGLQCPQHCLYDSTQQFKQNLLQQISMLNMNPKQNQQIMYGPVFVQYLSNICQQINQYPTINLQKAQDDIAIDQGYQAYKSGVKKYHEMGKILFQRNNKPDNNQINKILDMAKIKAFEEFYAKNGSDNKEYRRILEDYIKNKNIQIIDTYSEQQRNKNLEILEVQSKNVLQQIMASKIKDSSQINNYINQMTKNYQQNARGPQKYQILNDYMKVFTPIAFQGDPEKQAKLRAEMKKNQQLQQRLNQLKKQKTGGCCSSCTIM